MNETTEREREWVVSELADLIEERGAKTFLGAPLLVAAPRWFPDVWTPDVSGARAMLARVLGYAGLGALPFQLRTEADPTRTLNTASHRGAAAWFEGSAAGGLQFGVETSGLNDPEGLVGVFAHEVGHAFRAQHDLVVTSRDEEERLTDLTTVFLGFGVLTTNNAMRQRAVGTSLEIKSWGYLGARTLGYALAVQLAVRQDRKLRKQALEALDQDQRFIVKEALAELDEDLEGLRARLGLPPRPQEIVFRVPSPPWALAGAVGLAVGGLAAFALGSLWPLLLPLATTPLALTLRREVCSGPDCAAVLRRAAGRCGACGGTVVGRIADRTEHARAESDYLAQSDLPLPAEARELLKHALRNGDRTLQ